MCWSKVLHCSDRHRLKYHVSCVVQLKAPGSWRSCIWPTMSSRTARRKDQSSPKTLRLSSSMPAHMLPGNLWCDSLYAKNNDLCVFVIGPAYHQKPFEKWCLNLVLHRNTVLQICCTLVSCSQQRKLLKGIILKGEIHPKSKNLSQSFYICPSQNPTEVCWASKWKPDFG